MPDNITIPQFIDNEDRILGPITVRQFLILLVAGGILFICFKLFDIIIFIFLAVVIGGIAATLAFLKINGQPFHFFLLHIVQTVKNPSVRVWKKDLSGVSLALQEQKNASTEKTEVPHELRHTIDRGRLAHLSLLIDTGGAFHDPLPTEEKSSELF